MSSNFFQMNHDDYLPAYYVDEQIQVPKNNEENRKLKRGHIEDDNTDISYLNFPILRGSIIFTSLSFLSFLCAILAALKTNYQPQTEVEMLDYSLVINYGGKPYRCATFSKFPEDGFLSFINMFEINVYANIFFRLTTCLTIAVRTLQSLIFKKLLFNFYCSKFKNPSKFRWLYDAIPLLTLLETTSLALFSIITMKWDFKEMNHLCKSVFVISSMVNMFLVTSFSFLICIHSENPNYITITFIRCVCTAVFCFFSPSYFQYHHIWTTVSLCHSYIPSKYAIIEYCIILSYAVFHFLSLVDLQSLQFICYPRTSSGECEPLNPDNFKKGAKYEYCRSFELNQRRFKNISDI